MPVIINDEDISYAEDILSKGKGWHFDVERRNFITNIEESFDVQAVPGSGKTTALLAKLLILERKINNLEGGVLVLSHTNVAVDNIKNKIEQCCPNLFSGYPHFIGTVQSFVDEFLAKPFFSQIYKKKIIYIDDEFYNSKFKKYRYPYLVGGDKDKIKKVGIMINTLKNYSNLCYCGEYDYDGKLYYLNGKGYDIKKPSNHKKSTERTDEEKTFVFASFKKIQNNLIKEGILSYHNAFMLGKAYVLRNQLIPQILRSRFKYIFIDETQDLEKYKLELLDNLFYNNNCVLQRVGDVNQSIHSEGKDSQNEWELRENSKYITGSNRLHSLNANIVNQFTLLSSEHTSIVGYFNPTIFGINTLKPYLILYNSGNEKEVISKFISIIKQNGINEIIKNGVYKAIARVTDENASFGINKYCSNYCKRLRKTNIKNKRYHSTLLLYLMNFDIEENSLANIRKNILSSFIHIIRNHSDIKNITELIDDLKYNKFDKDQWKEFLSKLYLRSKGIYQTKRNVINLIRIKENIKEYVISIYLDLYGLNISNIENEFWSNDIFENNDTNVSDIENIQEIDGIKVEFDSIHGVKGENHDATLVMMTKYYKNDIEFFKRILSGQELSTHDNQAKKMFYVAFSRAKYILCYAINSDCITDTDLAKLKDNREVVFI